MVFSCIGFVWVNKMSNNKSSNQKTKSKKTIIRFKSSFVQQFFWKIVICICVLIIAYVLIYICFFGNGLFSPGSELEKKDWLSFLGAYLSFAGTLLISLIAILQSKFFEDRDKKRIADERKKTIQPILSVEIAGIDQQINHVVDVFSPWNPETMPKHKNVTIEIENVGKYPVRNVIVFDRYIWQMLKPNEKKQIQVAYTDSPDIERGEKYLIEILESEFARTDEGIPKDFCINYDDVDGNEMYQVYVLSDFEGTQYYSLRGTYDA